MARKLPISYSAKKSLPKLMIMGSSVLDGRKATLLRIRPTVVKRLESVAYGPLYLLIEHALTELCDRLEKEEDGRMLTIDAQEMNPISEDKDIIRAETRARDEMQESKTSKKKELA